MRHKNWLSPLFFVLLLHGFSVQGQDTLLTLNELEEQELYTNMPDAVHESFNV